jgi:hyperpolarization activated cyclic nucleotide-gated potassium channel 2
MMISACCWKLISGFEKGTNKTWLRNDGCYDSSPFVQFVNALYWAVVTCTTVGYGDILPVSTWELLWAIANILVGVIIFSTI